MTIRAYFLLADPDETDENQSLAKQAAAIAEWANLDVIDYMYIDDEVQHAPYIEYK
tara:strand:- start:298 stop:465 length:168 start_codon:yes stop_codon:yes gene_type:complete